jgi:hypothetical protein
VVAFEWADDGEGRVSQRGRQWLTAKAINTGVVNVVLSDFPVRRFHSPISGFRCTARGKLVMLAIMLL